MYTLSYDVPLGAFDARFSDGSFNADATDLRTRLTRWLTPARTGALGTVLLATAILPLLPWHADQAASSGMAHMLATAPRTALVATQVAHAPLVAALPTIQPTIQPAAQQTVTVAAPQAPSPSVESKVVAIGNGQTLATMLQGLGTVAEEAKAAMAAVRNVMDVRRIKSGQQFRVTMKQDGDTKNLLGLTFLAEPTKQITLGRDADGAFGAVANKVPVKSARLAAAGTVKGSLFDAAGEAGVPRDITREMMKQFAYTVDFQRDIHPGDKFQVYYNQDVTANGDKVGDASIVYATLSVGGKLKQLYRYEYDHGQYDYFDETGKSTHRALLRTPVDNPHITSGFGFRVHPILGFSKMHTGVDFGSPMGAPIYAAGDGVIEQAGWFSDYGRYVKIRHNSTVETAYGHMSNIASVVKPGTHVRQGQLIGYVGATGRATGPHLHYEVILNNNKVNPIGVNVNTGRTLDGRQLNAFKAWRQSMQTQFVAMAQKPTSAQVAQVAQSAQASAKTDVQTEAKADTKPTQVADAGRPRHGHRN